MVGQIPADMFWSYSKLTTYEHCPLAFKLQYLDHLPQTNNAYAEYGTLCHSLIERWATGELAEFELGPCFQAEFDAAVVHSFPPFPKGLGARYYDAGKRYFDTFAGFGESTILAFEERFEMDLGGYPFVGVADLLLEDRQTGDLILMDHKSKSLSAMKKVLTKQLRQLYLYAAFVKEHYGRFPDRLVLNLFREPTFIDKPFEMAAYESAIGWATDTIEMIRAQQVWPPCGKDYFCQFLCGEAYHCPVFLDLEEG